MKKILRHLPVLFVFVIIISSCGNKVDNSDPKAVLKEFFKRLSEKDIDGAAKLATDGSQFMMNMMKKGIEQAEKMKMDKKETDEDFKDAEFGEAKIDGETALVPITNKKKNISFDFPLKREKNSWKVDFSMESMMKMGSNMAGKEGFNADEAAKQISPEDLQKVMALQDSMIKNMDPKQLEQIKEMAEKMRQDTQQ